VKILLGRDDVNPDKPDGYGWTPLGYAVRNGDEGVVKKLLGRNDVNPDKPDRYGWTPIRLATSYGHTGLIALLQPPASASPSTA
jgi:ankyrin repeat protein